ncbi:hypothetical protein ACSAGD_10625 [Paramicrobacterium sp. CJ85]|uniref:hypothetical protein n=1 Tax=Paramicrobacterium sp. CJ85 TaxID=3445355 RepID=UPI003F5DD184
MSEYTPTTDEGWALVDLLKEILEDFTDEPQFTRAEHALMAPGQIRREWLAEHDAALIEKLADGINGRSGGQQESWLRARAAEIREGAK